MKTPEQLWNALVEAIDECQIAVIIEGQTDRIDGGLVITEIDELVEFLEKKK